MRCCGSEQWFSRERISGYGDVAKASSAMAAIVRRVRSARRGSTLSIASDASQSTWDFTMDRGGRRASVTKCEEKPLMHASLSGDLLANGGGMSGSMDERRMLSSCWCAVLRPARLGKPASSQSNTSVRMASTNAGGK